MKPTAGSTSHAGTDLTPCNIGFIPFKKTNKQTNERDKAAIGTGG